MSSALPLIDDPDLDALRPRLLADDATVRRLALIELAELAELEDDAHLPWLLQALQDPAAEVRREAADRLAAREGSATTEALVQALSDPDEAVREAAAHALTELREPASGHLLLQAWQRARHADASAFELGALLRGLRELRLPEAFGPALEAVNHVDARVRQEAVGVLGWLRRPEALPTLMTLAHQDTEAAVRQAAAGALGYAQDAGVVPALVQALRDAQWPVREEAATTLGKLRLNEALQPLIEALEDDYWQVRQRVARALGRLRNPAAVPALVASALVHSSANLRKEAAIALGEIADPSARPALQQASEDPDPEVRKSARLALASIEAGR